MTKAIIMRDMVAGYTIGDVITDPDKMADMKKRPDHFWHEIDLPPDHDIHDLAEAEVKIKELQAQQAAAAAPAQPTAAATETHS